MTFHRAAVSLALVAALATSGAAAGETPVVGTHGALNANAPRGGLAATLRDPVQGGVTPATLDLVPGPSGPQNRTRERRGNPLWTVPLTSLSGTRERPIFLPSRRPPAPPVAPPSVVPVRTPPPPAEPDRLRLALVGAVAGEAEGIAIFVEETTRDIVRLKTGEGHSGWILRSVSRREAMLQKGSDTVMLALQAPSDVQRDAAPAVLPWSSPPGGAARVLPGLTPSSPLATPSPPPPRLPAAISPPPTGRLRGL